ncbi:metal-dependent hydrolase [Natrarchaeobius sp. A-rgal3]|uniref:metal-dependent hydrolase n=1 Tax=Natrarchaeobius versutus TaxID=1679078 RepID=UPI003510A7AC
MWPWEHLAVAYLLYSLMAHSVLGRSPTAAETIAVAVGSQLPDLIDKPLAWTFGITETGYAVGHSIFVAPIVCLAVFAVSVRYDRDPVAAAFSFAYLSHLVTDVLNPIRMGRDPELRVVLWPVASPPAGDHGGFLDHFALYLVRHVNHILSGGLSAEVVFQLGIGLAVVGLWLADGAPVASDCWRLVRSRLE